MELTYVCKSGRENWEATLRPLKEDPPYEFEVSARGSRFHLLVGRHMYGNYLCIPNWGIGTEISLLSDCFWNSEHLKTEYPNLSKTDVISIVNALDTLGKHIKL